MLIRNATLTDAAGTRAGDILIENGRIALEGTSAELQANEHVKKAYLGI